MKTPRKSKTFWRTKTFLYSVVSFVSFLLSYMIIFDFLIFNVRGRNVMLLVSPLSVLSGFVSGVISIIYLIKEWKDLPVVVKIVFGINLLLFTFFLLLVYYF